MSTPSEVRLIGLCQDGRTGDLIDLLSDPEVAGDLPEGLEFVDAAGRSPLMYAAQREGHTEVLQALLDGPVIRASLDYQSPQDGWTALMAGAFHGALDCCELLVQRGADLDLRNHAGQTVMEFDQTHEESTSDARAVQAAIYSAKAALARPITPLEANDDDEEAAKTDADQMLLAACRSGNVDDAKVALDLDANVDVADGSGRTALMLAAAGGHLELVQLLIEEASADRDVQLPTSNNMTALMHAVRHGQVECVAWMIAFGGCAIDGLQDDDGQQADTLPPTERVTFDQMAEVIARAVATASSALAAAEANEDAAAEEAAATRPPKQQQQQHQQEEPDQEDREEAQDESDEKYPVATAQPEEEEEAEADQQQQQQQQVQAYMDQEEEPAQGYEAAAGASSSSGFPAAAAASGSGSGSGSGSDAPPADGGEYSAFVDHNFQAPDRSSARPLDARDARAFLDYPLAQALQMLLARYKAICGDFDQAPSAYIQAAVSHIAYAGQALILTGASASAARVHAKDRLDDATLHPLLEVLGYAFTNAPIATLDASFNHLGRASAQGLCVFLQHTRTLTSLNLEGNDIDRKGGETLAETLQAHPGVLTRLNLNTNPIGPHAIAKFAAMLQTNTTLTDVNLGNTDCETLSLMKLGTALQMNRTLKRLNLDSPLLYSYQEETTIHLARTLIGLNQGLVSLSLKGHRLSDAGAQWLAEYLIRNQHLTDLCLARNGLTTTGVACFVKPIAYRRAECLITFDGNILTGQRFDEIQSQIDDCKEARARNTIVWTSKQDRHSLRAKAPL